jgi:hypothetical protein
LHQINQTIFGFQFTVTPVADASSNDVIGRRVTSLAPESSDVTEGGDTLTQTSVTRLLADKFKVHSIINLIQ